MAQQKMDNDCLSEMNFKERKLVRQNLVSKIYNSFLSTDSLTSRQTEKEDELAMLSDRSIIPVSEVKSSFFWFKRSDFYVCCIAFMLSRVQIILQGLILPYYLQKVCLFKSETKDGTPYQLAVSPAVTFIGSMLFSELFQDKLMERHKYSRYNLFLYSNILLGTAGLGLYYIKLDSVFVTSLMLYTSLFLQGAAIANNLNTSSTMLSFMIGKDDE